MLERQQQATRLIECKPYPVRPRTDFPLYLMCRPEFPGRHIWDNA